jgi:hypothetical protein
MELASSNERLPDFFSSILWSQESQPRHRIREAAESRSWS